MSDPGAQLHVQRDARARQGEEAASRLRRRGVHGVVLSFVDTVGVNRIKTVPVERLSHAAALGAGMSPVFDTFLANDVPYPTEHYGGPDGDLRLVPDLDSLTVLHAQPGWAWAPVNRYTQDGKPYVLCQRQFLERAVDQARAAGVEPLAAIEIEWAVGYDTDEFSPACQGPAYGMTRLVELSDYARDVLEALQAQGISVEQIHPEYSDGQFEVSVAATDPLTAADQSVLVRQTIRAVSSRHQLRVSFAPSVIAGHVGNGGHVHISASRIADGHNIFADGDRRYDMTADGEAFAAGILTELPGLTAIGAPSPASYLRLVPSHWASAYVCWGRETREAALRFITGMSGDTGRAANLEVKCFDLAANPYLLLGCTLGVGLHGISSGLELPEEVVGDPDLRSQQDRAAHGIHRLPQSLEESTKQLADSAVLAEVLGEPLREVVLTIGRAEAERFAGSDPEEIAAALRWVY